MMEISTSRAFDRVEVDDAGTTKTFSTSEFLALPLAARVGFILKGRCRFFLGDEPVDRTIALSALRRMAEPS